MVNFICKCVYEVEVEAATNQEAAEMAEIMIVDGKASGKCECVTPEVV